MKFTTAALVAVISTVEAVKIDRTELKDHRDYDFQRDLRYHGKGKGSDKVDDVCLSACAATCALPDCIPLDATAAPTKGKGGKGSKGSKNKFGMSSKGKGSSSEAPSFFCSEAPSTAPSPLSSTAPSSIPSESPSIAPSTAPSVSPSSLPSAQPTDIGCQFFYNNTVYNDVNAAALGAAEFPMSERGMIERLNSAGITCTLASITSQAEQDAVVSAIENSVITIPGPFAWIGGELEIGNPIQTQCADAKTCESAGWGWLDGSMWDYQSWGSNQPDNNSGNQRYTAIAVESNGAIAVGEWFDVRFDQGKQNVNGGALFKCCQFTTGDVPMNGLGNLPLKP